MYKVYDGSVWWFYEHDTRMWAISKLSHYPAKWHACLPDDDEEVLFLPDAYAQWLPDN